MKKSFILLTLASVLLSFPASAGKIPERMFISHRGVHLGSRLCGENSLEALDFAKKAGFACVETDCRYTKDSVLVIIHDANINRTFTNTNGTPIMEAVPVSDHTLSDLRANYRYKSARPENRVQIQTLEEHLQRCKELGLPVFIEPKLKDPTGKYYLDIISTADRILGRDGYVVTSNNFANDVIRNTLGVRDVRLMGLLYQTDYDSMSALGNTIFAISSTAYSKKDFAGYVAKTKADGYVTETACCLMGQKPQLRFETTDLVESLAPHANYIATDCSAPDWHGQGKVVMKLKGRNVQDLEDLRKAGKIGFGAIYLEAAIDGPVEAEVSGDRFRTDESRTIKYRRMICDQVPELRLEGAVKNFKVMVVKFDD